MGQAALALDIDLLQDRPSLAGEFFGELIQKPTAARRVDHTVRPAKSEPEEIEDMRKYDIRQCTRDLLQVERAREWLLEGGEK